MRNRNRYDVNWSDIIRGQAIKRANFRCENCGVIHKGFYIFPKFEKPIKTDKFEMLEAKENGEKAYQVFLQVAHLDHNPANNNDDNLKVLCVKCHLENDREMNNLKRKSKKE